MDAIFCPVSFLLLNHEHELIEASEAYGSLDVVLGSLMTSWKSRRWALGVILVGRPLLGKVHHCSHFSPFVDNGSDCGFWSPKALKNGFITLSRLMHVNYFISHLFLNFFRSRHDVLLFKHASLCQTGYI